MTTIRIEDATYENTKEIVPFIKAKDIEETFNFSGLSMEEGFELCIQNSPFKKAVFIDDELMAVFGVGEGHGEEIRFKYMGHPWMVTKLKIKDFPKTIVKYSKQYVRLMSKEFPLLLNYVGIDNDISIRWLKRCGFIIDKDSTIVNGNKFFKFTMEG